MAEPLVLKISDPQEVTIQAFRGDAGSFRIAIETIVDEETEETAPLDISEATWLGQIRETEDSTEVLASFDFTLVEGEINMVDVKLTGEAAEVLLKKQRYDIQMTLSGDPHTVIYGKLLAGKDTSRL
jgi:hypothetical protein